MQDRFIHTYGLSSYDAMVLAKDRAVADYFEHIVDGNPGRAKAASNWVTTELFRLMSGASQDIGAVAERVKPEQLGELIQLVDSKTINISTAKSVFEEMFTTGQGAKTIVEAKGLEQISDTSALEKDVVDVLNANAPQVQAYLAGQDKLLQFFVGQVMKATKGKANPQMVQGLMKAALEKRRLNA
jgi:aspartyl-tRNA(Asn)/glutamyl-tRNA(Gln) amidotransferase subunit B